jgi:hypothetical protein
VHSKEQAEQILNPYLSLLAEPFTVAWDRWHGLRAAYPEVQRHLTPRARASIIYDCAAARARTIFSGLAPAVTLTDAYGFLLISFESQLHMRLKKFRNGGLSTSGISTQQRLAFEGQQMILSNFPMSTTVVLGYSLNQLQTEIERVAVKCSTYGKLNWVLDVPQGGGAVVQPIKPEGITPPTITSAIEQQDEKEERGTDEVS